MTLSWTRSLATMTVSVVLATCAAAADHASPTLVEVWCGGDDGLTQRLRDTLENSFRASPDFKLSSGKKLGTLVVTIPTHVEWKQVDKLTQVFYSVEFASADGQKVGTSKGSCSDDTLAKCAAEIVKYAKIAARKIGAAQAHARTQL